jgi:hypothetical protein
VLGGQGRDGNNGLGPSPFRPFETGWLTGLSLRGRHHWQLLAESGAAAGGPSQLWRQPAYQQGVVPPALSVVGGDRNTGPVRSEPDISADADLFTGMGVGLLVFRKHRPARFLLEDIGGTSLSSPLVAGLVTAAQQGQPRPFGFLNPVLYQLAGSSALFGPLPLGPGSPARFRAMFCPRGLCVEQELITPDDERQALLGTAGQVTLPGYDNMTGLGTPNGPAFRVMSAACGSAAGRTAAGRRR